SAFWHIMQLAAKRVQADIILVDIGPNLGAINRSVLIGTDFVVIPLGADLYSLQGLKNLGPTLRSWRKQWKKRRQNWQDEHLESDPQSPNLTLPKGQMHPLGYLCQQHGVRLDRPVQAYDKWVQRIPNVYRECVLQEAPVDGLLQENDPYCLATIKHYRSLVPMAQECRKPVFDLTSADGAIGSHANAVRSAREDFRALAQRIMDHIQAATKPAVSDGHEQ
ncbi:MAG: ParA family protein, partial [Desulfovibrionaceae bacterium]|nr:ParA family protein [Desulfovibrionaceae bacterium]